MSDLAYFEYALVLPEERYLIEVQSRKPESGELRPPEEIERIAKECAWFRSLAKSMTTNSKE